MLSNLTSNQSSSPPEDNISQFVRELFSMIMSKPSANAGNLFSGSTIPLIVTKVPTSYSPAMCFTCEIISLCPSIFCWFKLAPDSYTLKMTTVTFGKMSGHLHSSTWLDPPRQFSAMPVCIPLQPILSC